MIIFSSFEIFFNIWTHFLQQMNALFCQYKSERNVKRRRRKSAHNTGHRHFSCRTWNELSRMKRTNTAKFIEWEDRQRRGSMDPNQISWQAGRGLRNFPNTRTTAWHTRPLSHPCVHASSTNFTSSHAHSLMPRVSRAARQLRFLIQRTSKRTSIRGLSTRPGGIHFRQSQ